MKYVIIFSLILIIGCSNRNSSILPEGDSDILKKIEDAQNIHINWSKSNTLIVNVNSEPDNLHPTNGISAPRQDIFQYIHRTLIYVDYSNEQLTPGLVKTLPEISSDKLTYTY